MTKMAAMSIYGKNLLLQNQKPILRQGQIGSPVCLNEETITRSFNGGKLAAKDYID